MNSSNLNLWRKKSLILEEMLKGLRNYSMKSHRKVDLRKLRPMILKRIEQRTNDYPVKPVLPVAHEVLRARRALYRGVSTLIRHIPLWACKCSDVGLEGNGDVSFVSLNLNLLGVHLLMSSFEYCPETYIGEVGHLIRTCHGYQRHGKKKVHEWVNRSVDDIIVPVESFHLQKMFQNII